jgi:phosphodiesterase/alkaline phosphatase D-like protein
MGALTAYRAIATDEVDLVLHLGDYLYEESKGPFDVDPDHTCVTLEDYRRRHAYTRLDRDLQALHLRHPMVFAWDDHDVADNAWRHGAKGHDPEEHGSWDERLAAATQARQEWLPSRLIDPDEPLSMRRSFVIGDLAELVVLDTRIPGRDQQVGDDGAKPLDDPDRALLDPDQRRWARERILDRTRPWCLLASQVPVAVLELPVPLGGVVEDLMPSGYLVLDGEAVCTDLWEGYPAERNALVDAMARRGPGTVVLSGDVHSSWASLICDEHDDVVAVDLVCPAVSATEMGQQLPRGWRTAAEKVANDVPHQVWHDLERHGYLHVDVRPDRVRGDWYAADSDRDGGRPERLASWEVGRTSPLQLVEATPSSAASAFDDAVRPGVPLEALPQPEPINRHHRSKLARAIAVAVGVAGSAAAVVLVRRRARSR